MKELFLKPDDMAIVINDSEYGLKKESMWSLSKNNLILTKGCVILFSIIDYAAVPIKMEEVLTLLY
ncbi:hypothetical protein ACX163_19165 [Bacillus cereus]